jgi:hypothetical protein
MSAVPQNIRESTIASILGSASQVASYGTQAASYGTQFASSYATPENGSYLLNVLFYLFMYLFIVFIVMLIVHFSITPVFKFTPGANGYIGLPSSTDDKVYWNDKKQPLSDQVARVPKISDDLGSYHFTSDFSFSVDLFVRRIIDSEKSNTRVILYKTFEYGNDLTQKIQATGALGSATGAQNEVYALPGPTTDQNLEEYMKTRCSMYMYLSDTNNLGVTFFSSQNGTPVPYSIREIKNIPLYTPFRVTVVCEGKIFTVYVNGKQAFQRIISSAITLNSNVPTTNQRFYASPEWAKEPTQTIFLQNLHLWPRAITYKEVTNAQPALALASDFEMKPEVGTDTCT